MSVHTLAVLVENKPGVLARTTSLFARRGFTLDSVSEGTTRDPAVSRVTITVDAEVCPPARVRRQIGELVDVVKVVDVGPGAAIRRGPVLVKVRACHDTRSHVIEIVRRFRARIVDVSPETVTIEATGTRDTRDALLTMLGPFGITALVRSRTAATGRGSATPRDLPNSSPSSSPSPVRLPNQGEPPWPSRSTTTTPTRPSPRAARPR